MTTTKSFQWISLENHPNGYKRALQISRDLNVLEVMKYAHDFACTCINNRQTTYLVIFADDKTKTVHELTEASLTAELTRKVAA